jgi:hypothetical protein
MIVGWYRSNGEALLVVSTNLLHMFEQTMVMLPFATRTDMYEAVQNSKENKTTKLQEMLNTIRAEHDQPGVRAQLRSLWIARIRAQLDDDDEPGAAGAAVLGKAVTPPLSPK